MLLESDGDGVVVFDDITLLDSQGVEMRKLALSEFLGCDLSDIRTIDEGKCEYEVLFGENAGRVYYAIPKDYLEEYLFFQVLTDDFIFHRFEDGDLNFPVPARYFSPSFVEECIRDIIRGMTEDEIIYSFAEHSEGGFSSAADYGYIKLKDGAEESLTFNAEDRKNYELGSDRETAEDMLYEVLVEYVEGGSSELFDDILLLPYTIPKKLCYYYKAKGVWPEYFDDDSYKEDQSKYAVKHGQAAYYILDSTDVVEKEYELDGVRYSILRERKLI